MGGRRNSRPSGSRIVSYDPSRPDRGAVILTRGFRAARAPDVSFEALDLLSLRKGRNSAILSIPLEEFEVGDFAVEITISDQDGVPLDMVRKVISVRWMGLADQIRDVDEAVEQLTYIAKGRELKWLKSGDDDTERAKRFHQFWKKRDWPRRAECCS